MINFLDLSGVGNSGKSAVVDLLKEVDTISVSDTLFEFDILRVPNGVLALRQSVVTDWSPIRSNQAIKNFRALVKMMGINPKFYNIRGLIASSSQRYDAQFQNKFIDLFNTFTDSLVVGKYNAVWPYDFLSQNSYTRFFYKVLNRLGFTAINESTISLVSGIDFDKKFHLMLSQLFSVRFSGKKQWVTLNNGFEPYNPKPYFQMLNGSKQIVILRDPRDVYVSGKNPEKMLRQDKGLLTNFHAKTNFSFLGSDDLDIFVKRYDLYRKNVMVNCDDRVLRVNFEDICCNYEEVLKEIFIFLDIDPLLHTQKKIFFKPEASAKNVGLWKKYSGKDEIAFIETHLSSYLYSSE